MTLAGFHANSLATDTLARAFAKKDMLAYVEIVQRKERENGVEQLMHQRWSGVELRDKEMEIAAPFKVSTQSTSEGLTETQFHDAKI